MVSELCKRPLHHQHVGGSHSNAMPCAHATRDCLAAGQRGVCRASRPSAQNSLPTPTPQHTTQRVVHTCAGSQRGSFSSDESQKALQYQLQRTAPPQTPAAEQPSQDLRNYEQDLRRRQTQAREWITPWLTTKARTRSMDTLASLRQKTEGLTPEQQDTALKRLLGQSWQVAAAHPVAYDSDEETASVDEDASSSNGQQDQVVSWEDGIDLSSKPVSDSNSYQDALQS